MPSHSLATLVTGLALLGAAGQALAQQESRFPSWFTQVQGGGLYQFPADLDGPGDFSLTRWFFQPSVGYAWDRRNSVAISFGGGQYVYDFADSTMIAGGKPWERINTMRLSLPIRFAPIEQMDVIVVPSIRTAAEDGADLDDGRTEGVLAGALWRFSDDFKIGPGLGWFSEVGGGSNVFPILLIDWKFADRWRLSTGGGLGATQGPGLTLSYQATDALRIGLSGRYEQFRFALDDSGPAPNGYGEDESFPLVATVQYEPWPAANLSAFAGVELGGRMQVEDSAGRTLDTTNYDPAPLLGFTFRLRF